MQQEFQPCHRRHGRHRCGAGAGQVHGCVKDFCILARLAGDAQDGEIERLVLRGLIPLHKQDEGLETVAVATTKPEIYTFFDARLTDYEAQRHHKHLLAAQARRPP